MKRYLFTLLANTVLYTSARISICYYSSTRRKSLKSFESVILRVGNSVVQISNVPTVDVLRTLRVTLIACLLLPYYIAHAAHLDPVRGHLLDSLKKVKFLTKVKMSMRRLSKKIDSCINGRFYNFNGVIVKSTPPLSYIRSLLPRFSGARHDDALAIARVIRSVATAPQRMARFGIIVYDHNSILSTTRAYYKYLQVNSILTDEDKIILHNARCLTRYCNVTSEI
jgi:hypothetical protein